MSEKVYAVVIAGYPEDYSICAMFDNEDAANKYCAVKNFEGRFGLEYAVEEYDLHSFCELPDSKKVMYKYDIYDGQTRPQIGLLTLREEGDEEVVKHWFETEGRISQVKATVYLEEDDKKKAFEMGLKAIEEIWKEAKDE